MQKFNIYLFSNVHTHLQKVVSLSLSLALALSFETGTCYVAQAGFELGILLAQFSKFRGSRCAPNV